MRYLVTGAGLIGSAIATRLVEEGHEVRIVDVSPTASASDGTLIQGDIRDLDKLLWLTRDTDGVFHTAALHGIHSQTHSPAEYMSINVLGTFNVLEAAHRNGVKRVVHSSTTGVIGGGLGPRDEPVPPILTHDTPRMPGDYYGTSKLLAEDLCESYSRKGLEVVALRYGGVRQLVQSFKGRVDLAWAMSGHLTDVRDAVNANVRAMELNPMPPRGQYLILPTTVLQPSDFPAQDIRALLASKIEWLSEDMLPSEVPRPSSLFDASETEKDLGIKIEFGHEDFLREALGLEEGAGP